MVIFQQVEILVLPVSRIALIHIVCRMYVVELAGLDLQLVDLGIEIVVDDLSYGQDVINGNIWIFKNMVHPATALTEFLRQLGDRVTAFTDGLFNDFSLVLHRHKYLPDSVNDVLQKMHRNEKISGH